MLIKILLVYYSDRYCSKRLFIRVSEVAQSQESVCNAGDTDSIPGLGRFPWRRKWQPAPIFLPGKSHGQRSLVCYSPWGRKESDTTERLHFHFLSLSHKLICLLLLPHLKTHVIVSWTKIIQDNFPILRS